MRIAVLGIGATPLRTRWAERSYFELALDAVKPALADAGIGPDRIASAVYGIYGDLLARQSLPDVFVHDYLGLRFRPATRTTAGGATGGAAIHAACLQILSGLYDVVLVVGVEKGADCYDYESGSSTLEILKAIGYSADTSFETAVGFTPAATFALSLVAHIDRYGGPTAVQMAKVAVKNRDNARLNPIAQAPRELTVADVLRSRPLCHPFRVLDACPTSEGAAALVLASEQAARAIGGRPVWITGLGAVTDTALAGVRPDRHDLPGTRLAFEQAYRLAGIADPRSDLDLAELYDPYTGIEILNYELAGLCPPGEGGRLIDEGVTGPSGDIPVNQSGGLLGCGNAVGATALVQLGEVVRQVRGEAGQRQLAAARRGVVQSQGGPGAAWSYAFVLEA